MRLQLKMAYPVDKMLFMTLHVEKQVSPGINTSVFQACILYHIFTSYRATTRDPLYKDPFFVFPYYLY